MTYPLLVVKSRLQAANKDTHVDLKYTGAVDAVTRIWKHEGEQLPPYCMKVASIPPICYLKRTAAAVQGCSAARRTAAAVWPRRLQSAGCLLPLAWELQTLGWQYRIQGGGNQPPNQVKP